MGHSMHGLSWVLGESGQPEVIPRDAVAPYFGLPPIDFDPEVLLRWLPALRAHPVRGKGRAHLQFDKSTNLLSSLISADSRRVTKGASYA